jgi:hypothetical protein
MKRRTDLLETTTVPSIAARNAPSPIGITCELTR